MLRKSRSSKKAIAQLCPMKVRNVRCNLHLAPVALIAKVLTIGE
ncbi:hypothetical protein [Coleofasciculus sp. H7-2]